MFVPKGYTKTSLDGSIDCSDSYLFSFHLEVNIPPAMNMPPLEDRVTDLERDLRESREEIKKLLDKTERQADIIERLIVGLYDPVEQRNYRKFLFDILEGDNNMAFMDQPDTSKWQQEVTTKQGNVLEKMVEGFDDRISKIEHYMASIESVVDHTVDNVANVQSVVYTLIGGLFNIDTQKSTVGTLVARLFGRFKSSEDTTDTSVWKSRPTTMQCDEAEKRLDALERKVFG